MPHCFRGDTTNRINILASANCCMCAGAAPGSRRQRKRRREERRGNGIEYQSETCSGWSTIQKAGPRRFRFSLKHNQICRVLKFDCPQSCSYRKQLSTSYHLTKANKCSPYFITFASSYSVRSNGIRLSACCSTCSLSVVPWTSADPSPSAVARARVMNFFPSLLYSQKRRSPFLKKA